MSPCSCKNRRRGQQVALWQTGEGVRITAHNRHTAEIVVLCCCRLDLYLPASIMLQKKVLMQERLLWFAVLFGECEDCGWLTCPPCLQPQSAQVPGDRASSQGLLSDWATTASPCHWGGPGGWWHCGGFGTSHPAGQSWCRLLPPPFPQRHQDTVENL